MKVCTDACLFGSWTAQQILRHKPETKNILDIGTGTGLLSLMLAQQFPVPIDAVEIDGDAASQALENVESAGLSNVKVHHMPITDFLRGEKYDWIIVNPPFYEGDLRSPDQSRNAAMHDRYLTLARLLEVIEILLDENGCASILLPSSRIEDFVTLLGKTNFGILQLTEVRHSIGHNLFRFMFVISRNVQQENAVTKMAIYDNNNQYTEDFKSLLKEYYLAL